MKSNSATETLQAIYDAVVGRRKEIANLQRWAESNAALQTNLENDGDITSVDTLDQITRCQCIAALIPRRMNHLADLLTCEEGKLLELR